MHVAVEFVHPIIEKRRAFPAYSLTSDMALVTAIGNDSDFSQIFAEQLRLQGRPGDVVLGISTSGMSANINYGLEAARQLGMLTVGFAGKDGGRHKRRGRVLPDRAVVQYSSHPGSAHDLAACAWDMVHVLLGEEDII